MRGHRGIRVLAAALCALSAAAAGCGGTARPLTGHASTAAAAPSAAAVRTTAAPPPAPQKPLPNPLPRPKGPGPHPGADVTRLVVKDVVKGTGPALHAGDAMYMDYIAANYTRGNVYDFAWGARNTGATLDITYLWMPGLVKGLEGMRAGGRRILIVPRNLSDGDSDRAGNSYREIVYWDIVLRGVIPRSS